MNAEINRVSDITFLISVSPPMSPFVTFFIEVHAEKENGKVIGGKINSKVSGKWEQREANLNNAYVVVRKRKGFCCVILVKVFVVFCG